MMNKKKKFISAFVVTVLCFAVFSAALTYSSPSEGYMSDVENTEIDETSFPLKGHSNTAWILDQGSDSLGSVSGTHYEMGYQHGAMVPEETRQTMRAYLNYIDEDVEDLLEVYEQGEPYISDEYKEEMEGLSDGAAVCLDEVNAVHSIPTLYHCSGFGVSGEGTKSGAVYHTRSLDYGVDIVDHESGRTLQMNALTLFRDPDHGYGSAVPAWSGFVGSVDGMNEEKISIGEMGQSTDDSSKEGNFMIFRIRDTLEKASNMEEAVSYMKPNRTYGFGFVVADGESNTSQMIEMSHSQYYNGTWNDRQEDNSPQYFQMEDVIRRGNRYAAYNTALTQRDNFMVMPTDSGFMHLMNYLEHSRRLEREYGDIDFDTAEEIFADAYRSYPLQMTIHHTVFSPSELKIRRANAYPEGTGAFWNEYHEYSFPMVESQPDLLTLSSPTNGSSVSGEVDVVPDHEYTPDSMKLYINGVEVEEKTSEPFEFSWDSSTVSEGDHVVEVRAYGENYSAVAYNTVTVTEGGESSEPLRMEHESVRKDDIISVDNTRSVRSTEKLLKNLHVPTPENEVTLSEDDWVVNETVYLNDTTQEITGNVIIQEKGSLIMSNSTLTINSSFDGEFGLIVTDGGSLIVNESTITNMDHDIYCQADSTAEEVSIIDSRVEGGGDSITSPLFSVMISNVTVERSTFVHRSFGFVASGGVQDISVMDSEFMLEDTARLPVADIFTPRSASLMMNNVEESTIENITITGKLNGKMLGFGILLFNSQSILVSDVHVEHEFGGVGLLGSIENELNNITVMNSHAGVVGLMNSQHNVVEDLHVEHTAIGFGNMFESPYNTFKDVYLNDTTIAFAAEGDSNGMKVEDVEIKNSRGAALLEGSSDLILRNITLEADYAGLIFGGDCHDSVAENITMDLGREFQGEVMEFPGVAIDGSDNVKLHDIEVRGTRYALKVQGDHSPNFELDISDFKTESGEVEYHSGSAPDEITGDQVFLHNIQDSELNVETIDGPVYLTHAHNVTLNASVDDAVSGIIVDRSNNVTLTGEVVDSYSHGVKIDNSQGINIDVDVSGAYWGYSIKNSEDVYVEGETTSIKDAMVYVHTTSETELNVQASGSAYGVIAGYSEIHIVGSMPPFTQEPMLHESTITISETDHIEIEPQEKTVGAGKVVNYTATAYDELGQEIGDVTEETDWSIDEEADGEWDQDTGAYTSENVGEWTVTANYTENGQDHKDTATLVVNPVYELTIDIEGEGSTTPEEGTHTYDDGEEVTVTAAPEEDWYFKGWTGSYEVTEDEITIIMDADKEITAVFEIYEYELSIVIEGEGEVWVDVRPDDAIEDVVEDEWSDEFPAGTVIDLTANPDQNWYFEEWKGSYQGTEDRITVTMDENKSLTAVFEEEPPDKYDLTIEIEGEGIVEVDPEQEEYDHGTEVNLTAIAEEGWEFINWTGDVESSEEEITIVMDQDYEITAVFEEVVEYYELTVNIEGEGEVEVDPEQEEYEEGTEVELTAVPEEGWYFYEWTGDVPEDEEGEQITITMDQNKEITAVFEEVVEHYELTVNTDGEGEVEVDPEQEEYEEGTEVNLTAIPEEGWSFAGWTGDVPDEEEYNEEITLTMDEDKQVMAHFETIPTPLYPLTLEIEGEGSVGVDGEEVETPYMEDHEEGTEVTLKSAADDDWEFVEWTGDYESEESEITLTMDQDYEITAVFEEVVEYYELTVNIDGEGEVDVDPEQDEYEEGTVVELTASPEEGWEFVEWTGDETGTDPTIEITMDSDITITAHFEELEEAYFEVNIVSPGDGDEFEEGDEIVVEYEVMNTGVVTGEQDIELYVGGELVDTEAGVEIEAGVTYEGQFAFEVEEDGTIELEVRSSDEGEVDTISLTISAMEDPDDPDDEDDDFPWWLILVVFIVVVLAAVIFFTMTTKSEEGEEEDFEPEDEHLEDEEEYLDESKKAEE